MGAVYADEAKEPEIVQQLPNDLRKLKRFFERWSRRGEIRGCYEASGAGYVLQREMTNWGHACDVVAPSLIPVRPGERRKHDRRDATQLARLYRAGELVAIRIPSAADERVRDLVRCRQCFQREVLRSLDASSIDGAARASSRASSAGRGRPTAVAGAPPDP